MAKSKTKKLAKKQTTSKATIKKSVKPFSYSLPNAFILTKLAAKLIWQNKKLFIGITIIYGLLNLLLVQGIVSSSDVSNIKNQLNGSAHGGAGSILSGVGVFALLVGTAGNGSSQTIGAYQLFLALIASLAIIYALRNISSNKYISVKLSYYRGMAPLIPFVIILILIGIQLLPLLIGTLLYSKIVGGIAIGAFETIIFLIPYLLLITWSLYMLACSLVALYIVTLNDMEPRKALRAAKQLVKNHRLYIIRKIIYLPVMLLVVSAIVMLPIILLVTSIAQWVFFILTMLSLTAIHTYMYTMYRELLNVS